MGKNNQRIDAKQAESIMLKAGYQPLVPYVNSRTKWKCRCLSCKKISYPMLKHVKFYSSTCRYCRGTKVDEKEAIAFMKQNGFVPLVTYPKSQKPWKCRCKKCGKVSSPRYSHVVQRGHCCKFCAPNAAVSKGTALRTFKDSGFEVLGEYINAKSKVDLLCLTCGGKVKKNYSEVKQGQGCGICAGVHGLDKGKAHDFFLANGFEPLEAFKNVNVPWKSRCLKCQKRVSPTYGNVRSGKGCPYCQGNKVDPEDAEKLMYRYGFKPLEPYLHSQHKWRSIHISCGNEVFPQYTSIQQGYGGCRFCAPSGFQYARPSYLYFIEHDLFNAYKVGIANQQSSLKKDRLHRMKLSGWQEIRIWSFDEGTLPSKIEAMFFAYLRTEFRLFPFLSNREMKYGGATETFDREQIQSKEVIRLIESFTNELSPITFKSIST